MTVRVLSSMFCAFFFFHFFRVASSARERLQTAFDHAFPREAEDEVAKIGWDLDFSSFSQYKRVENNVQDCVRSGESFSGWMQRQARGYKYTSLASLVDNSSVKHFVRTRFPSFKIPATLAVFKSENLDDLYHFHFPESFAFKAVHGSGMNFLVCKNLTLKGKPYNVSYLYSLAQKWLRVCYRCKEQRQYANIQRAVIVEEYLSVHPLIDYKVFVFQGEALLIQVKENYQTGPKFRFYWRNWAALPTSVRSDRSPGKIMRPPQQLGDLLIAAGQLGQGFRFVRVDLYIQDGDILFGELTFSPVGGSRRLNPLLNPLLSAIGLCVHENTSYASKDACPREWSQVERYDRSADSISAHLWHWFFSGKCRGRYLEIGAHDGRTASNSFLFSIAMNWTGVLVEGSPTHYQLLQQNRPRDKLYHAAVCNETQVVHFVDHSTGGGILELMSPSFRKRWHGRVKEKKLQRVSCMPLSFILEDAGFSNYDFFTLDVEGGELEVLRTINFSKVSFGVMVVELNVHNQHSHAKIEELLGSHGYMLVKKTKSGKLSADGWFTRSNAFPASNYND